MEDSIKIPIDNSDAIAGLKNELGLRRALVAQTANDASSRVCMCVQVRVTSLSCDMIMTRARTTTESPPS